MKKPNPPVAGPSFAALSDAEFHAAMARAVRALPDVPPALQRAALALFPARPAGAGLLGLAQAVVAQIQAVLTFDSWASPAMAAGMRSLRSPTRHLLFSAQGRDVDLRIAPQSAAAEAFALTGQILGPDLGGQVELQAEPLDPGASAAAPRSAALDDLGEFRIDGLARGVYRLTLQLGGEQIVLPALEVGPGAGTGAGGPAGDPAGEPVR